MRGGDADGRDKETNLEIADKLDRQRPESHEHRQSFFASSTVGGEKLDVRERLTVFFVANLPIHIVIVTLTKKGVLR